MNKVWRQKDVNINAFNAIVLINVKFIDATARIREASTVTQLTLITLKYGFYDSDDRVD